MKTTTSKILDASIVVQLVDGAGMFPPAMSGYTHVECKRWLVEVGEGGIAISNAEPIVFPKFATPVEFSLVNLCNTAQDVLAFMKIGWAVKWGGAKSKPLTFAKGEVRLHVSLEPRTLLKTTNSCKVSNSLFPQGSDASCKST